MDYFGGYKPGWIIPVYDIKNKALGKLNNDGTKLYQLRGYHNNSMGQITILIREFK